MRQKRDGEGKWRIDCLRSGANCGTLGVEREREKESHHRQADRELCFVFIL